MSTKKTKKTEKAFEVREINEAERKILKDGNVPGKAIDLKLNKALPPQVMDEIVEKIVGPMVASTVGIVQAAFAAGWNGALDAVAAKMKAKVETPKAEKKPAKGKKAK